MSKRVSSLVSQQGHRNYRASILGRVGIGESGSVNNASTGAVIRGKGSSPGSGGPPLPLEHNREDVGGGVALSLPEAVEAWMTALNLNPQNSR